MFTCPATLDLSIFSARTTRRPCNPRNGFSTARSAPLHGAGCIRASTGFRPDSVTNVPGIDGVLADSANVHAVQAAIAGAGEHRSPADGLQKVWTHLDDRIRDKRAWRVVFVADCGEVARDKPPVRFMSTVQSGSFDNFSK
ncbi:hypothetical protein L227DRAFT_649855 [Lentinus tigrinus ALCF2SS1-6]|uniref:Uncharacterized protein n=1 Tax=Lentinus tigrinus ALCF2SS1-6 TaxID=1328759 RepID=A0A5C2SNF6_9APHY|nr:hypothetical protein L227DRAFT_649855 [Lentinus tigrinus ALCF2SS1-6]